MSAAPDAPELPWLGRAALFAPSIVAWAVQGGISNRVIWFAAVAFGGILSIAFAVRSDDWRLAGGGMACVAVLALMGAAFLSPSARGAGPALVLVLSQGFMVLVGLCAILVTVFPERTDREATLVENTGQVVLFVLALVAAIGASWHALHRIVRSYESKRCSELQVALNGYWSLIALAGFAMVMSMSMYEEGEGARDAAILAGSAVLVCWLGFRLALRAWLWAIVRSATPPLRALLLLRVFKGSSASEAFLDRFVAYWRFAAPVWMIGGPDLAGAQMEPTEFFAFLRRRLDRLFVRSPEEISERVGQLDGERDPDGRLRINELFCSNSTWQATVLALLERAAVVMLDLRRVHGGARRDALRDLSDHERRADRESDRAHRRSGTTSRPSSPSCARRGTRCTRPHPIAAPRRPRSECFACTPGAGPRFAASSPLSPPWPAPSEPRKMGGRGRSRLEWRIIGPRGGPSDA